MSIKVWLDRSITESDNILFFRAPNFSVTDKDFLYVTVTASEDMRGLRIAPSQGARIRVRAIRCQRIKAQNIGSCFSDDQFAARVLCNGGDGRERLNYPVDADYCHLRI